jgi:hypothetical protein
MPTDTNPDETPTVETPAESGAAADPKPEPPAAAEPVAAPRSRRGLVIAGAIVGAVVVLGATFGGGVLVGSATADHGHRPMMQHGQPAADPVATPHGRAASATATASATWATDFRASSSLGGRETTRTSPPARTG